jgi:pimeloyl-ACP methyl ester carboxylesterase
MKDKKQAKQLEKYGVDAEFGYIEVGERAIHYTLAGRDSTKPLVMLVHGSPGSSSNFLYFAKDSALLSKYQVLLVDRPGFGYSDFGKSEPSLELQAELLAKVLNNFYAEKKVLVGHSLGGPIICRIAMDSVNQVDGLLIVAGSVSPELEPEEKWRKPLNWKIIRWIFPRSFRVSNQEIIPAKTELEKMVPLWPNIICPVIIIQGEKDKLVPPGNAAYAKDKLVNAESVELMMLKENNHFIPFKTPEIMTEALLRFPLD